MARRRTTISIRRSLLASLLGVIALLSAAILATSIYGGRRASFELSKELTRENIDLTKERLTRFFDPVERSLMVAREWGQKGVISPDDRESVIAHLQPILRQFDQVSSAIVADDRGHEVMLLRSDAGGTRHWRCRQTKRDEWGDTVRWLDWEDGAFEERNVLDDVLGYEPRSRDWWLGAIERFRTIINKERDSTRLFIHWTDPYEFFTTQQPGISAAMAFVSQGRMNVVAFDVLLEDISQFTTSLEVGEHGSAFVLTDDWRIIGLPRDERYESAQARTEDLLKHPAELTWPLARDAVKAFDAKSPNATQPGAEPLRFESGGRAWWGQGSWFVVGPDRRFWISVVVPERDLLAPVAVARVWIVTITGGVMLCGVLLAFRLARRFSAPIEELVAQSDRIARLELEPGEPIESQVREVRRLAEAQNRMREALASLLKLEQDLQVARRIQQATLPTTLPRIEGFEIRARSEPAEETAGDSYDIVGISRRNGGHAIVRDRGRVDRVVLLLADATGHGIGPALSATEVRAMLRMGVGMERPLRDVAATMNEQLFHDLKEGRFVTAWLGQVDARSSKVRAFSAGQGPILRLNASSRRIETIGVDSPPLGVLERLDVHREREIDLAPGDLLLVASDGLYEAASPFGEQFGISRVGHILRESAHKPVDVILDRLWSAVDEFLAGGTSKDDRTAIIIRAV